MLIAVVAFVVGVVLAWRTLGEDLSLHVPALVVLVLVGGCFTIVVNASEYRIAAAFLRRSSPWSRAISVAIIAAAGNLLPLPGSLIIRTGALTKDGSGLRQAVKATAAIGFAWLGLASVIAGALLVLCSSSSIFGVLLLVVGFGALGSSAKLILLITRSPLRLFLIVLAVEVFSVIVTAARLFLAGIVLGVDVTFAGGLVLAVAGAIASAIGLVPGGLGIREGLSALLGPMVGLAPSEAFLLTALDRVSDLAFHAIAGVAVGVMQHADVSRVESE